MKKQESKTNNPSTYKIHKFDTTKKIPDDQHHSINKKLLPKNYNRKNSNNNNFDTANHNINKHYSKMTKTVDNQHFNDKNKILKNSDKCLSNRINNIVNTCPNIKKCDKIKYNKKYQYNNNQNTKNKNLLDTYDLLFDIENKKISKNKNSSNNTTKKTNSTIENTNNKNHEKTKIMQEDNNLNDLLTQKLWELIISITPKENNNNKTSENLLKNIKLENNIKEIKKLDDEINDITQENEKKISKIKNINITTKSPKYENETDININNNLEIIKMKSITRMEIYKKYFDFISKLLIQIDKLSNNIANNIDDVYELKNIHNVNDINKTIVQNMDIKEENILFNNLSFISKSLFESFLENNEKENILNKKKYIENDSVTLDLNCNEERNNSSEFKEFLDEKLLENTSKEENYNQIKTSNNAFSKNKSNKFLFIHPNEILSRIHSEDKKLRRVLHHYSNSLKVNSNEDQMKGKNNINNRKSQNNIQLYDNGNKCEVF